MARFPYHTSNIKALGKLIAEAALNAEAREKLTGNPNDALAKIGLPPQTIELMRFKVIDESATGKAVAIPFRLNEGKLQASNEDYLTGIASMVSQPKLN